MDKREEKDKKQAMVEPLGNKRGASIRTVHLPITPPINIGGGGLRDHGDAQEKNAGNMRRNRLENSETVRELCGRVN